MTWPEKGKYLGGARIDQIKIPATDKPYAGSCSRCQGPIDLRSVVVVTRNDSEFWYCATCREGMGL
jgi:hypothetical protein